MRSLALDEYHSLTATLSHQISMVFPSLLMPTSSTQHLSALIELKAGVGGTEASLFVTELLRMYIRLANSKQWKTHIVSRNDNDNGGTRDATVEIKGAGSYDTLRWESGVHRVQRVPATEASGRTHTSTVAVVVGVFLGLLMDSILLSLTGFAVVRGHGIKRG
jgi:peptide chain release factor 1